MGGGGGDFEDFFSWGGGLHPEAIALCALSPFGSVDVFFSLLFLPAEKNENKRGWMI